MQSSPLQELNLKGCRFRLGMPLPRVSTVGTSCLSIISHLATNQNNDQLSRNFTQILGALRLKLPTGAHSPTPTTPIINTDPEEPYETFHKDSFSNSADGLEFHDTLIGKKHWPNLVKLSLTEAVAYFQV